MNEKSTLHPTCCEICTDIIILCILYGTQCMPYLWCLQFNICLLGKNKRIFYSEFCLWYFTQTHCQAGGKLQWWTQTSEISMNDKRIWCGLVLMTLVFKVEIQECVWKGRIYSLLWYSHKLQLILLRFYVRPKWRKIRVFKILCKKFFKCGSILTPLI